ncbi:MAG TPA: hypothetical protein VH107_20375, partial [Lacipirellulaceae bacterium]|nr:hypothetical protein [Lacipirellulaceae bacterium]
SGNAARSFGSRSNSVSSSNSGSSNNGSATRSFQSQADQGSRGRFSSNSGGQSQSTSVRQGDSRSGGDAPKFSNKSSDGSAKSSSRSTVLGQQIQSNNSQNNNQQSSNQQNSGKQGSASSSLSNRSSGNIARNSQFRGNDTARIAENDDHKNKGDNRNNNSNSKGNNGQNNQGQNNSGQNKGQNNSDGQNRDSGKNPGNNPASKTGTPFNGKNDHVNVPGSINKIPGNDNGSKFDPKNSDRGDKNFKFGDQRNDNVDKNHDGKPDNQVTVKDLFEHRNGDNHQKNDRQFRDRDFHGKDSDKAAFNKWNDVWKGKNGSGKDNRDWSGKWRSGDRFVAADAIRHDFFSHHDLNHGHDWHNMPFQASWWDSHHGHDHNWGFWGDYASNHHHHPWYWWNWTTAPALATYCSFGWGTPYYWDYGQGEYINCNGGNVYVNGRLYEPTPVYYAQTVRLIDQAPLLEPDAAADADWMPLGVFAVTPDGANQPSVIMQLAITKNGIIGGTASDQQAGASYHIDGTVDQKTQRAVWSYMDGGNNRIVMESSINNLTQNESTGLIHFGPNDQRVVEFVRMPEPNAQGELPMPQQVGMPAGGPGDDGPSLPPPEQ